MWQEILVIVLIVCAIAGVWWSVHKQRQQPCEGDGGCKDCPLADKCTKKKQHL